MSNRSIVEAALVTLLGVAMWGCDSPSQEEADEVTGEATVTITSVARGADGQMIATMKQLSQSEFKALVELRSSIKSDVEIGVKRSALITTDGSVCGSWDSTWFFDRPDGTGNVLCVMWTPGGSWPGTADLALVNVPHPSGNWAGRIRFVWPGSQEGFLTDSGGIA